MCVLCAGKQTHTLPHCVSASSGRDSVTDLPCFLFVTVISCEGVPGTGGGGGGEECGGEKEREKSYLKSTGRRRRRSACYVSFTGPFAALLNLCHGTFLSGLPEAVTSGCTAGCTPFRSSFSF